MYDVVQKHKYLSHSTDKRYWIIVRKRKQRPGWWPTRYLKGRSVNKVIAPIRNPGSSVSIPRTNDQNG